MIARGLSFIALALLAGCSTGGQLLEPPTKAEPVEVAAAAPDAFADFSGEKVDAGTPFRLDDIGRGVRGVEVVVKLTKVRTSSWTPPGGAEQVEGTATIKVYKGELPVETLRIVEGDSATAHGAKIEVHEAKVDYHDSRMDWLPVAKVTVSAAPR